MNGCFIVNPSSNFGAEQRSHNISERARVTSGFSLIELLVVITLLSITLAIAIPRLESRFQQAAVSSVARDLINLGNRARLNAISQRATTTLLVNNDARTFRLVQDYSDTIEDLVPVRRYESTIDVLVETRESVAREKALSFKPDGTVSYAAIIVKTDGLSRQLVLRPELGRFVLQ